MNESHYKYFKRVLFTNQSIAQRVFNYFVVICGLSVSVAGWIEILLGTK